MPRLLACVLAGSVAILGQTLAPQQAHALPGECNHVITWYNGTTTETDEGTLVETGIHAEDRITCDFIEPTDPASGPSGTGAGMPTVPLPAAPPGPVSPPPPTSNPASAAPPCVPGSNNADSPGSVPGGVTGSGQTVLDNLVPEVASGDVKIEAVPNADDITGVPGDAVTKSVTLDVNVGTPVNGHVGSNPFEGYTAEQAAQAMYWDSDTPPQITEVGALTKVASMLIKVSAQAIKGDQAARRLFFFAMSRVSPEVAKEVTDFIDQAVKSLNGHPETKQFAEDLIQLLQEWVDMPGPISAPGSTSPESLYVDSSNSALKGPVELDNVNKGACGQVAAAVASDPGTATALPAGPHWVRITLIGTQHGALVHQLKTLTVPSVACPPTTVNAIAGQVNMMNITAQCSGSVTGLRLLTRAQIDELSSTDRAQLLQTTNDAQSDLASARIALRPYDPANATDSNSVSLMADGNAALSGDSKNVNLYYKPALTTGGASDALVAMAKGSDGQEHPFLVRIAVKAPPSCSAADGLVGTDHMAYLQNGRLELQRNTTFTIDPKLLCTTDIRDSLSVTLGGSIAGTAKTINSDGSITYTWTDPDVIGLDGTLTFTAWDRDTGAPSTPVSIPVHIRDAAPICADVHARYDTAAMAGAPLSIALDCTMTGSLKSLHSPVPMIVLGSDGGRALSTPGGTFAVTPTGVIFTPTPGYTGTSAGNIIASSSTPFTNNLDGLNSKAFTITVAVG